MFYFKENEKEYRIKFTHDKKWNKAGQFKPFKTICHIIDLDIKTVVINGEAKCSDEDQFCYKTGRKIAFERAINSSSFTKATKQLVWNTFLYMSKP